MLWVLELHPVSRRWFCLSSLFLYTLNALMPIYVVIEYVLFAGCCVLQPIDFSFQSGTDKRIGWWRKAEHTSLLGLYSEDNKEALEAPMGTQIIVCAPTRISLSLFLTLPPLPLTASPFQRIDFLPRLKTLTPLMCFWGFYSEPAEGWRQEKSSVPLSCELWQCERNCPLQVL